MTNLKKVRLQKGIEAVELAKMLKITRQAICVAERKGVKYTASAQRYAKALNCTPEEVLEL